jgi:hypothetical protein
MLFHGEKFITDPDSVADPDPIPYRYLKLNIFLNNYVIYFYKFTASLRSSSKLGLFAGCLL